MIAPGQPADFNFLMESKKDASVGNWAAAGPRLVVIGGRWPTNVRGHAAHREPIR